MRIDRASPGAVRDIARAMRDRDFEEFSAVHDVSGREELAQRLADLYGRRDDVQIAYYEDRPVAVIGQLMLWPGVVSLLFFATKEFGRIVKSVVRVYSRVFDQMERVGGVHRIQAVSLAGYTTTHKFLGMFGLAQEGPPMRAFGKDGQDFIQFARVRHGDTDPPRA